jgi:hypothetical protein
MERDLVTILGLGVAFAVFYAVAQSWGWWLAASSDVLFALTSGFTAVFALLVVRADRRDVTALTHLRQRLRRVHIGFFLAILLWFVGEFTWLTYEVILGVKVPYPSVADVFYLAGYIPALVSIIGFMAIFRKLVTFRKKVLSALVGLLIIGTTGVLLLHPLSISSSPTFVKAFDLAYPLLDAVLMALVMMRLIAFVGTSLGRPWVWIFGGLLSYSFADIMFSWGTLTHWYYSGHPIELLWLYGYLVIALGFNRQRKQFVTTTVRKA